MASQNGNSDESLPSGESNPLHDLGALRPGDAVDVWEGGSLVAKTVLTCEETVDDETSKWLWTFMDDGSLIEASPDGFFWYREHRIENQGTTTYEELVAQDGALVRFEARVREGASARRPVHVTIDGKEYRITSTGTVTVQRNGPELSLPPWKSFSSKAEENVYFGLVNTADEAQIALGLWTTHVCLSFGRELGTTDVTAVYRR